MTFNAERSTHPDLIDEERAAAAAPPAAPPPPARGGRRAPQRSVTPSTGGESVEAATPAAESSTSTGAAPETGTPPPAPGAGAESGPPEWWQQVKDAPDPKAALALLAKNLPRKDVEQDPTLQGWLGAAADRRARALLAQQEQERHEQAKHDAAAQGDFYGLGQLTASEIAERNRQQTATQQTAPFMDGVVAFQSKLPPEVQAAIGGKAYGVGRSYSEGVSEYLEAVSLAMAEYRQNEAVEKELKRREPALRKAWLSEVNGSGPTPEIDGGPAPGLREITDEQLAHMSLAESELYLDERGQPRPGVRVRLTRGIPIRQR